jgi:putative acetyltransferase
MVILIGGTTHVGKTALAQKLMEKFKMPYLSLDHLKMGIYRGLPECGYTPESDDRVITNKLWPVVKAIIMTNIENNQNIIIEGCYLPYSIHEFEHKYYSKIIFFKFGFSSEYIHKHLQNKILKKESSIEYRSEEFNHPIEKYIQENEMVKNLCAKGDIQYFEINKNYKAEIKNMCKWVHQEYKNRIAAINNLFQKSNSGN